MWFKPLAPFSLMLMAGCGVDSSDSRVANMTRQEADQLNDAAAMIDQRTEQVDAVLNDLPGASHPPAEAAPPSNTAQTNQIGNAAIAVSAPKPSEAPGAKTLPNPAVQNSASTDNPQKK